MKKGLVSISVLLLSVAAVRGQGLGDLRPFGQDVLKPPAIVCFAIPSHLTVAPGQTFHVAMDLEIAEGWVYYSPDPGPYVKEGKLAVETVDGLDVGQTLWPVDTPKYDPGVGVTNNTYSGRTVLYVPFTVPQDAQLGREYQINIEVQGQVCREVCEDIRNVQAVVTVVVGKKPVANPAWQTYPEYETGLVHAMTAEDLKERHESEAEPIIRARRIADWSIWTALGLALLAGLSLNIMPCVLPVIPLRILSIVELAGQSRRRFVTMGLAFAGGIMLFFVAIALVNLVLRILAWETLNISEHFQYREVRIVLALIIVALSANLFGAFNVVVPRKVAALGAGEHKRRHVSVLGMGVMMAILATPCSAAFLAGAMAWAQVKPLAQGTAVLLLIGVGMAFPHALLCAFPRLVDRLPKPGRWMELFKQAMGFVLLPVAIWLFATLTSDTYPFWVAVFAVVFAFGLWMWGNWLRYDAPFSRKLLVRVAAVVLVVGAGMWMLPKPSADAKGVKFVDYDPNLISQARAEGRTVVVKFTATWCTKCFVIDRQVYEKKELAMEFAERNILAVKADVTERDTPASELLRQRYGGSPPVTVVYPPQKGKETVLIGGFDVDDLLEALDKVDSN